MFSSSLLPKAFARAYAVIPEEHTWQWADREVTLVNEDAAEPGPYRSAKTPWTRRLQELDQKPISYQWDTQAACYVPVKCSVLYVEKSSQSGYSEACMNGIRWHAKYRPVNTIYAIDSESEAKKVARRLLRSLKLLDANIFTGDPDDIKSTEFLLRGMELNFYGSFASGKFANKQAGRLVADEVEEHGASTGDTSTLRNLESRMKTVRDGLMVALSKPKKDSGPIHRAFLRGNQEEFCITCPHCAALQPLTFFNEDRKIPYGTKLIEVQEEQTGEVVFRGWEPLPPGEIRRLRTGRIVFDHCKDLLGNWDKLRILRETYFECGSCQGRIEEWQKQGLINSAVWIAFAIGTPGIVSQHINDLYSSDPASAWGQLVLKFLDAKHDGITELQGFYNHQLGLPFKDEVSSTEMTDISDNIAGTHPESDNCPPYKRGIVPFPPVALILGSDVGLNYAKWSIIAVHKNLEDVAVVDWGCELDPSAIAELILSQTWQEAEGRVHRISSGFIDAKYRMTDVYRACLSVPGRRLIPCAGLGGGAARNTRAWSYNQMPGKYPRGFSLLSFNDRDAKDELYVIRIKRRERRVYFPVDVAADPTDGQEFINELCAEELIRTRLGHVIWNPHPGANHYGDTVKLAVTGLRYLTRKQRTGDPQQPAADQAQPTAPEAAALSA